MQIYWLWFALMPDVNLQHKIMLLEHFSDPETIYEADEKSFANLPYVTPAMKAALTDKNLTKAERVLRLCRDMDIGIVTFHSRQYPAKLKNIADPPLVLYYRGQLPHFNELPVIGIAGTRSATPYGCRTAKQISGQIAACGAVVVSGGALGIDTSAMVGALSAGMVVGFLAGGVDTVYPTANAQLFARVTKSGCLISEYPPQTRLQKWSIPRRNKLISAISNGVLVVEAPTDSGALITARQAYQQGRDLFVVPGNIDVSACAGSNALLQERGTAVLCGWDVVKEYAPMYPGKIEKRDFVDADSPLAMVAQEVKIPAPVKKSAKENDKKGIDNNAVTAYSGILDIPQDLTQEQKQIVSCLTDIPVSVDLLIDKVGLPAAKVLGILTVLSLKGIVENHPGKRVCLRK